MKRQNGFVPLIIILIIAVLGVVGYLGYKNLITTPIVNILNEPAELAGVPIYPNSSYNPNYNKVESYVSGSYCGERVLCKTTSYEFGTADSTDMVFNWYRSHNFSGWKFSPTTSVTDQGQDGKEYYGSIISNSASKYTLNILASFGMTYGIGKHSFTFIKADPAYTWPIPSNNEIENWITFKERDGLFTFKHPKDLFVKEGSSIYENPMATSCPSCLGQSALGLAVIVKPNIGNLTSESFAVQAMKRESNPVFIKNKPKYFNDMDLTIIGNIGGAGEPGPNVVFIKNDKVVEFQTEFVGVEELNKILSTLKFNN